jgi:hypothetical protein
MYALILNEQIEVGPRNWYLPAFVDFLEEVGMGGEAAQLNRVAPTEIVFGTNWRIVPVRTLSQPSFNPIFEQLEGPITTVLADEVTVEYNVVLQALAIAKSHLINIVKDTRYKIENGGLVLTIDDIQVVIPTDRESRNIILTGAPGKWKFKQVQTTQAPLRYDGDARANGLSGNGYVWLTLTDSTLDLIVASVRNHVQEAFNWEARVTSDINLAQTIAELKLVDITPLVTIPNA